MKYKMPILRSVNIFDSNNQYNNRTMYIIWEGENTHWLLSNVGIFLGWESELKRSYFTGKVLYKEDLF